MKKFLMTCVLFLSSTFCYADDLGVPVNPRGKRPKNDVAYKVMPQHLYVGTIQLSPGYWGGLITTNYDILPYWHDLEKAGGAKIDLKKNLLFDVKYDDATSLYVLRELINRDVVKKIPAVAGHVDQRIYSGKNNVSLISTGHQPPSRDLSADDSVLEHDFTTKYTMAPGIRLHSHHMLKHNIVIVGQRPEERVTNRICVEFETWVPELSAEHAEKWGKDTATGFVVNKITNAGEVQLFIQSVGSFRRGIFSFDDTANLTTEGMPIQYRIKPVVHDGAGWVDDKTRSQVVITLK